MTQEEKQLLLIDLCSRMPYGVRVKIFDKDILLYESNEKGTLDGKETISGDNFVIKCDKDSWIISCDDFKPYLRPMSSMTRKEIEEGSQLIQDYEDEYSGFEYLSLHDGYKYFDWLNAHHFDYRGLIPMGLALEAPEDMYKID